MSTAPAALRFTPGNPLPDASIDQIFREARTFTGWLPKPVPADLLRQVVQLALLGPTSANGSQLNLEGFRRMQAGDYTGALVLLAEAARKLNGTGAIDEAYAKYNLAFTRFALGQCTDVLALLDEAQAIEGKRSAIDDLRRRAKEVCKGG